MAWGKMHDRKLGLKWLAFLEQVLAVKHRWEVSLAFYGFGLVVGVLVLEYKYMLWSSTCMWGLGIVFEVLALCLESGTCIRIGFGSNSAGFGQDSHSPRFRFGSDLAGFGSDSDWIGPDVDRIWIRPDSDSQRPPNVCSCILIYEIDLLIRHIQSSLIISTTSIYKHIYIYIYV